MWLLIERIDATRVASLFYLGPPVTMFMAWVAFGDNVRAMDIAGLIIVFVGVLLSQFRRKVLLRQNN
jgi:drug/metabolite transporter (DMT)-like permease